MGKYSDIPTVKHWFKIHIFKVKTVKFITTYAGSLQIIFDYV